VSCVERVNVVAKASSRAVWWPIVATTGGEAQTHPLEGPAHCTGSGRPVCPACRSPYYPVQRRPDPPLLPPACELAGRRL